MFVHEIGKDVAEGKRQALSVVDSTLAGISKGNSVLNAFLSVQDESARNAARDIDGRIANGQPIGRLAGVPIAIKDNICTRIGRTTCASRMLEKFESPYDAHVVQRLLAEDAIVVGKTNLDEFAMGCSNEHSAFGSVRNPWHTDHAPGGSSGGSAAAVAAGLVPCALGSDTGGSVRLPAALCGVVGLKPSYGRVSRYGLIAYGSSLDQVGPLAHSVKDVALLMSIIAGCDSRDVSSKAIDVPDFVACCDEPLGHFRIGIASEYFDNDELDPQVRRAVEQAIEVYREMGAEVVSVQIPHLEYAIASYYIIATSEASSNLARFDGVHYGHRANSVDDLLDLYCDSRAQGFGQEVKRRIMLGTFALSSGYYDAYYAKALKVRALVAQDFMRAFEQVDVLACPTAPFCGIEIGQRQDSVSLFLSDTFTAAANLAGICAISVPCGFSDEGLPIGLQLQAKPFNEGRLMQIAHHYQLATDWHQRRPDSKHYV